MMLIRSKILGLSLIALALSSCVTNTPEDERGLVNIIPTAEKDRAPDTHVDLRHLPDAVPRYEERTIAGNKSPYMVKGIVYRVMEDPSNFEETGIASWYGAKFHGNTTSNNEIYDMYAVTGAHKTLPIPSYVRVTNLENNKSVVVRINDRGPFAEGRVVDLSYAGAQKLGYIKAGTAQVKVEYIDTAHLKNVSTGPVLAALPDNLPEPKTLPPKKTVLADKGTEASPHTTSVEALELTATNIEPRENVALSAEQAIAPVMTSESSEVPLLLYLQIGAYFDEAAALSSQFQVASHTQWPVVIDRSVNAENRHLFRVQLGPLPDELTLELVKKSLMEKGVSEPMRILK